MARRQSGSQATVPVRRPLRDESRLLSELVAIVAATAAVFAFLSFLAYQGAPASLDFTGRVGYGLADAAVQALGLAAYLGPAFLGVTALLLFRQASGEISIARAIGALVLILCVAILLAFAAPAPPDRPVTAAGGWIGGFLATLLAQGFGTPGSILIVGGATILAFVFVTRISLGSLASLMLERIRQALGRLAATVVPSRQNKSQPQWDNVRKEPATNTAPIIVLGQDSEEKAKTPSKRREKRTVQEELPFGRDRYLLPPVRFLESARHNTVGVDEEALRKSSQILEAKLADFGIVGQVVEVRPGPVITTFDIEPAPGVKVNRIVSLTDDLAMALRVPGVRILAPVPGKAVVGIEVANPKREEVKLRDLIEAEAFARSPSVLPLALGKDTAGAAVIADLARMPHLMIAGATGSGKSVAINAMIMSILLKATPHDVRFVMIDLKMLELSVYEDIPHLLVPVVTDAKQAVVVLNNIVTLMEERYQLMRQRGVRNIDGYNRWREELADERESGVIELKELADESDDGDESAPSETVPERLPQLVVIVDELADLMMVMGRKVEEPITRLAQKARAAGIHLLVATQRPSVDVITGLIKANFPARVSFQTTARVDSRTILDHIGAERLLGRGDMLYLPAGSARLERLHGPMITEAEIHKVATFIKRQGKPEFAFGLLEGPAEEDDHELDDDLSDELYDQAVRLVTDSRQASISWVQRRLRVGYNRAARMIERMEREGVVSTSEGGRPRDVLAQRVDSD